MQPSKPSAASRLLGFFYAGLRGGGNSANPSNRVGPHSFAYRKNGGNLIHEAVGRSHRRDRLTAFLFSGRITDGGVIESRRKKYDMFLISNAAQIFLKTASNGVRP